MRVPSPRYRVIQIGSKPDERGGGGIAGVIAMLRDGAPAEVSTEIIPTIRVDQRLYSVDRIPPAIWLMARRRRGSEPVVVHVHLAPAGSTLREGGLALAAKRLGLPVVVTIHSSRIRTDAERSPLRKMMRRVFERVDVVHVLGSSGAEIVREIAPAVQRLETIPNGVRVPETPAELDQPVAFFAGEIGRRKGADTLLEAWPMVHESVPEASLILAGPLAPGFEIEPLPAGVTYLGRVEPSAVSGHIAESGACVLPSRAEAFPLFLLEAMAAGSPIVTTPVGDVPDMLGGLGTMVPVEDPSKLAGALADVLGGGADARRHQGGLLRNRAIAEFEVSRVVERTYSVYQSLL